MQNDHVAVCVLHLYASSTLDWPFHSGWNLVSSGWKSCHSQWSKVKSSKTSTNRHSNLFPSTVRLAQLPPQRLQPSQYRHSLSLQRQAFPSFSGCLFRNRLLKSKCIFYSFSTCHVYLNTTVKNHNFFQKNKGDIYSHNKILCIMLRTINLRSPFV